MNDSPSSMLTRERAKSVVMDVLRHHGLSQAVRGSWKYDDFHLTRDGAQSQSDLDLVMDGVSDTVRRQYADVIQNELNSVLALRVSIHGSDSLLEMNLGDSFVLCMGEFIAKTSRITPAHPEYSYTLAKISLLLLRDFTRERYLNVSNRIRTCEAETAIGVKLGEETYFSTDAASKLLSLSAHSTVDFFLSNCVLRTPKWETIKLVKEQVRQCSSIAPWLQEYLISKMDSGAA